MSNKNLLNENTVRRFMKLAEIEPLTDQFVDKINEVGHGDPKKIDPKRGLGDQLKVKKGGKKRMEEEVELEEDVLDEDIELEEMELEEGESYQDDDGMRDPKVEEGIELEEDMLDEEIEALLQEMELEEGESYQDDEMGPDEDEDPEDDELAAADLEDPGMEDMDEPDMGGGISVEELSDMLVPALKQALGELAEEEAIEVKSDAPEKVDVGMKDADADMMGGPMEEEIVNEVARRVMNRIIDSRR